MSPTSSSCMPPGTDPGAPVVRYHSGSFNCRFPHDTIEEPVMTAPTPPPIPTIHQVERVIFTPLDARARVGDTGLEVFEIVRTWQWVGEDWRRLTEAYHWLT